MDFLVKIGVTGDYLELGVRTWRILVGAVMFKCGCRYLFS